MHVNLHIIHPEYRMKLQLVHHTNCAQMKYMKQIASCIDSISDETFCISIWDDPVLCRMVGNPVNTVCDSTSTDLYSLSPYTNKWSVCCLLQQMRGNSQQL